MNPGFPERSSSSAKSKYFDAHNHLQDEWLSPQVETITAHLAALPIEGAVVNGTWDGDWPTVVEWADRFPWVVPSFGLHPWMVGKRSADWLETLERLLQRYPRSAVGEIGLDRWILERARPNDPRLDGLTRAPIDQQVSVFTAQLELAERLHRAASIHCLDAWGLLGDLLRASKLPRRGFLLHAYSGPAEMIPGFAERGAYFSFNGSFLDHRKERHRQFFQEVPWDRLLVETDAPAMLVPSAWRTYKLPPAPDGSPINHPANIEAAYAGLAALRGVSVPELSEIVEANFKRLFLPHQEKTSPPCLT